MQKFDGDSVISFLLGILQGVHHLPFSQGSARRMIDMPHLKGIRLFNISFDALSENSYRIVIILTVLKNIAARSFPCNHFS